MPLLLLTHHLIPWAFKTARQLVNSALAQPQAECCPPNTKSCLECLSENQQNTAEQHTSVISRDHLLNNTCSTHVDTPCDESCEQLHRGSEGSRLSIVPKALLCIPRAAVLITKPMINFTKATVTTFLNMTVHGLSKIRRMLRILFPLTEEDFDYSTEVAIEIGPIGGPLIVITCFFTVICLVFFRFLGNCVFRLKKKVSQALSWVQKKTSGSKCQSETQQYSYEELMFLIGRDILLNNTSSTDVDKPCDESREQFYIDSQGYIFLNLD